MRGGSREMDMVLQAGRRAGAVGAVERNLRRDADRRLDAAITSSTSLISFRLEEDRQSADLRARAPPTGSCWSR